MDTPTAPPSTSARPPLRALWSFTGRYRTLHLTWFAFFLSFVVWFNFAPFATTIGHQLHLSKAQVATLGLCNLALTVPARMLIGMALDRFGPRRVYAAVLMFAAIPNTVFALASNFAVLVASRLALSVVGAGFVVGIRMVAEWFPPAETGTAEGIYGGWGNFGAGAATLGLPTLAGWLGGADGWRWAIGLSGLLAGVYGVVYLRVAADTPSGRPYLRPSRQGALEVTSRMAVWGLVGLTVPVTAVLGLIAWRVHLVHVLNGGQLAAVLAVLVALLILQVRQVLRVNAHVLAGQQTRDEPYSLVTVAALCLSYFVTFGAELAVSSMLPAFFGETWHLGLATAGGAAGTFGIMNLVTRPGGGRLSDALHSRRRTLVGLLAGSSVGFALMAALRPRWPIGAAVLLGILASAFVQAGNGAVFAIVPLVKRRVGGQIAGLVGAYGNIGGVVFLFVLLFVSPQTFFLVISITAAVVTAVVWRFLPEAVGSTSPAAHLAGPAAAADPVGTVLTAPPIDITGDAALLAPMVAVEPTHP